MVTEITNEFSARYLLKFLWSCCVLWPLFFNWKSIKIVQGFLMLKGRLLWFNKERNDPNLLNVLIKEINDFTQVKWLLKLPATCYNTRKKSSLDPERFLCYSMNISQFLCCFYSTGLFSFWQWSFAHSHIKKKVFCLFLLNVFIKHMLLSVSASSTNEDTVCSGVNWYCCCTKDMQWCLTIKWLSSPNYLSTPLT